MNNKLMRSRNDKMVAGVCGGIGAYFEVDPTLVRLIMVLGVIALGSTLLVYPLLWLIMPVQAAASPPSQFGNQPPPWVPPSQYDPRQQHQYQQPVQTPNQATAQKRYRFDPYTGQPLYSDDEQNQAATGPTININQQQYDQKSFNQPVYKQVPARRNNPKTIGMLLVAFGIMVFASEVGVSEILGPLLFIGLGILLLVRHKRGS